jgi:hypothetical protein
MFSPFIQYSENMDNSAALPIVETVGCLVQNQGQNAWQLIHATLPASVTAQATGSAAVKKAAQASLGNDELQLIGLSPFHPARYQGQVVAVRGVATEKRLNVTSLVTTSAACYGAK